MEAKWRERTLRETGNNVMRQRGEKTKMTSEKDRLVDRGKCGKNGK
jgi:hypothetical protein